jgi:hypothetical protein
MVAHVLVLILQLANDEKLYDQAVTILFYVSVKIPFVSLQCHYDQTFVFSCILATIQNAAVIIQF